MAMNFYRSDGWVKTVQGPAVSGAQVYVCTQPANVTPPITPPRTTPVPWLGPNPQALIYSDNGLTPITQPVITDGFGHYNFYALPGLYTVVVMYGGKVQEVLVDQSLGNVGTSSGTSILFETNGSPNFNQTLQNLVQGAGVTIVTDNLGNTVISSSSIPTGLVLKTNGILNGSQALLNLVNGSGINITQDGLGNTTLAAVASSGQNVVDIPWVYPSVIAGGSQTEVSSTGVVMFPASSISVFASHWKITIDVLSASIAFDDFSVARTLPGSLNVIDWTPVTFGGTNGPTLAAGMHTSDSINLQIDAAHDYYFMCHEPTGSAGANRLVSTDYSGTYPGGTMGNGTVDQIGVSPIQNPLFTGVLNSGMWIVSWQAA